MACLLFFSLAVFLVSAQDNGYPPLSCEDQVAISNYFLEVLDSSNYGNDATPGDTAAKWVRLAFHDAVTWTPQYGTGGTHACIAVPCNGPNQCERTSVDNAGLSQVADNLEYLWINGGWRNTISRPDWWHLAAKVAIEWASGGTAYINWGWGRTECKDACPYWPQTHPHPQDGYYAVQQHLVDRLGFTWEESISLLGAHSLGETHIQNSGYQGRWVPYPANYFNNNYYKNLLKYNWYGTTIPGNSSYGGGGGKFEYITNNLHGSVMLPVDGAMQYNLGSGSCTLSGNPNSNLYKYRCPLELDLQPIVEHFASDNSYWLNTFASAFETLQNFGGDYIAYNPAGDVEYDLSQTNWQGYPNWYTNPKDYGINYHN